MNEEKDDTTREKFEWDKNLIWALPIGVVLIGTVVWAFVQQLYTNRHQFLEDTIDTILTAMALGVIGVGIWGFFKLWNKIKRKQ